MATHSNGMSARQLEDPLGATYKTAWLLAQKLRRSMVDPDRDRLEGVVEVDQTEIPFRAGDAFFEPGAAGLGKDRSLGEAGIPVRARNRVYRPFLPFGQWPQSALQGPPQSRVPGSAGTNAN